MGPLRISHDSRCALAGAPPRTVDMVPYPPLSLLPFQIQHPFGDLLTLRQNRRWMGSAAWLRLAHVWLQNLLPALFANVSFARWCISPPHVSHAFTRPPSAADA